MKTSIWDILTGITLLGVLCIIGAIGMIMINPASPLNIFKPPAAQPVPTISLPSPTNTATPGLPPTWTPTPSLENTQAPETSGDRLPSSTPVPTFTVVVLPTFTPSRTPRTGLGGGSCQVVYQNPVDNAILPKGADFDMRWTIKNTSSKSWASDSTDIRFLSGDRVHVGNDVRDMPYDVASQGMVDIVVNMRTPLTPGSYVTNWSLSQGSASVCRFYVQFQVQ
jgi:hypothetical protein